MVEADAIGEVNRALKRFAVEVNDDELARNRAGIAVVALRSPGLRIQVPPTLARDFRLPTLEANGATPMGSAIQLGLGTIREWREEYRSRGAKACAAMMFLITDGSGRRARRRGARARAGHNVIAVRAATAADYLRQTVTSVFACGGSAARASAPGSANASRRCTAPALPTRA